MKQCITNNYSSKKHIKSIINELDNQFKEGYIDSNDLQSKVISVLKSSEFSTDINNSADINNYNSSIDSLITDIEKYLLENFGKKDEDRYKQTIKSDVKKLKKFLEDNLKSSTVDFNIKSVIGNVQKETSSTHLKLNNFLYNIYRSGNLSLDSVRQQEFIHQLRLSTIINLDKELIIDSEVDVCTNIMHYLNNQYKIIYEYLKQMYGDTIVGKSFTPMYILNSKTGVMTINSNANDKLRAMYSEIVKYEDTETLQDKILSGWTQSITHKEQPDNNYYFYKAVMAYTNIEYFDDILKDTLGDFISIDNSIINPINVQMDYNNEFVYQYKYKIRKGNINNVKLFGDEIQDSNKVISKFSKVIIESIPIYDYSADTISSLNSSAQIGFMELRSFVDTFTKLKNAGQQMIGYTEFRNAVLTLSTNTREKLKIIYDELFSKNSATIKKDLNNLGFDRNNLNIFYSFYKTVLYPSKKSFESIEKEYLKNNGIKSRYNLVECIINVITSNSSMNYLQTQYDSYLDKYVVSEKQQYSISDAKYDLVNSINDKTIDREDKLSDYKLNPYENHNKYELTLPGNIKITLEFPRHNILSKNNTKVIISNVNFNVDISTNDNRNKLLNAINNEKDYSELKEEEKTFIEVLKFIDTLLGTSFTKSEDDMYKLYLSSTLMKNDDFIKDTFLAATRSLLINNIYTEFRNSKLGRNQIIKFSEDNQQLFPLILQNIDKRDENKYFYKRTDGKQLKAVLFDEKWVIALSKANSILSGETVRSTVSDFEGNKNPNSTPSYLGAEVSSQIQNSKDGKSTKHLLFSKNPEALIKTVSDFEVQTKDKISKKVKKMTKKELLYHSIVDKILIPYVTANQVYIQPTTLSDKTKFINGHINLKLELFEDLDGNYRSLSTLLNMYENLDEVFEHNIILTIGEAYKSIYNEVINDFKKLFNVSDVNSINEILKNLTEEELLEKVRDYNKRNSHIEIFSELHYRVTSNKKLALNELLFDFANRLYTPQYLHERMKREKINYVKSILENQIVFANNGQIKEAFIKFVPNQNTRNNWIYKPNTNSENSYIALAKVKDINTNEESLLISGPLLPNQEIISINPMISTIFFLENYLGNNLRYSITGSEINHPIKQLSKLDLGEGNITKIKRILKNQKINYVTFYDLYRAAYTEKTTDLETQKKLRNLYENYMLNFESSSQNTQFKRNSIISATMLKIRPSIYGTSKTLKVACIEDDLADVFSFDGIHTKEKANDGSALINPFQSILENKSLGDNESGDIKKPIHHHYNPRFMTSSLLKYSTNAITNNMMRRSEGNSNGIRLRNVFKKMTDVQWKQKYDLINGCALKLNAHIDFKQDICNGSKGIYYRNGEQHYLISDFGITQDGVYYTQEQEATYSGELAEDEEGRVLNPVTIYHYFDSFGNHHPSKEIITDPKYHTINSLFELHTALGGIYSESVTRKGNLQYLTYSEASNYAVTQYINLVSNINGNEIEQPLKQEMIHVLANITSMKEGAGNINTSISWYDNTPLQYIELDSDFYGIQQDANHTADESYMTEFSQVINFLDINGYMHTFVKGIYQQLGQVAYKMAEIELNSVKEFRELKDKSKIYEVLARTIFNNLRSGRGRSGLGNAIVRAIEEQFNVQLDHSQDNIKVPFSDPNIYGTILSTFVSGLNKKSIKRKFPGLGTIMCPSYNTVMIYDIDGRKYQYDELLQRAYKEGFNSEIKDLSLKNRDVVSKFLESKQAEQDTIGLSQIIPTDNIIAYIEGERFNLDSINTREVEYEISEQDGYKGVLKIYVKGHKEYGSLNLYKTNENGLYYVESSINKQVSEKLYEKLFFNLKVSIPSNARVYSTDELAYQLTSEFIGDDVISNPTNENINGYTIYKNVSDSRDDGNKFEVHISLNNTQNYYSFTEDPIKYLRSKGYFVSNPLEIKYKKDVTVPRNLAPSRITYEYDTSPEIGKENIVKTNIFNHWRVRNLIKGVHYIENFKKLSQEEKDSLKLIIEKVKKINPSKSEEVGKYISNIDKGKLPDNLIQFLRKEYNVSQAMRELDDGYYIDEDNNRYKVSNLQNKPAEVLMSNIYKSTFGLRDGDTLNDVLDRGPDYFLDTPQIINSTNFDMAFTARNGKNLYISFKPFITDDSRTIKWKDINRQPILDNDGNIIAYKVYAISKDNVRLFEIGREILDSGVQYNPSSNTYIKDGKTVKNQKIYRRNKEGKVYRYIEFVSNNIVYDTNNGNDTKYQLYNINRNNIAEALAINGKSKKELNIEVSNYISDLLSDIYNSDSFSGVELNNTISELSGYIIKDTIDRFGNNLKYDNKLFRYLINLANDIRDVEPEEIKDDDGKVISKVFKFKTKYGDYQKQLAQERFASFIMSQSFTSARIPSQNLASVMQMENVGFTGEEYGQCFVSYFQTFLQGSDYDIDKSYLMGLSFNSNGIFIGWNNLFDYSTIELLQESTNLPFPKGIKIQKGKSGISEKEYLNQILKFNSDHRNLQYKYAISLSDQDRDNLKSHKYSSDKGVDISSYIKQISDYNKEIQEKYNSINEWRQIKQEGVKYRKDLRKQGASRDELIKIQTEIEQITKTINIIYDEINNIKVSKLKVINKLYNLIHELNTNGTVYVYSNHEDTDKIIDLLQSSENTNMSRNIQLEASKNYASIGIQRVVQGMKNKVKSYIPTEIQELRNAVKYSSKSNEEASLTMLNPYMKIFMQEANMTGKDVIGIGAVSEKVIMAWNYYLNEKIRQNPNDIDIELMKFNFTLSRVIGRHKNKIQEKEINTLPNLNTEGVDDNIIKSLGNSLNPELDTDESNSQMLSAAADNAKELVLYQINSGSKFAKMHLFLIALGVDFNDIISFMTSPVALFINDITDENIYYKTSVSVYDAIEIALGKNLSKKYGKSVMNQIINKRNMYYSEISKDIIEDVKEFKNILEGSEEFSRMGQLLSMNQGLPTSESDLQNLLSKIKDIIDKRLSQVTNIDSDIKNELLTFNPERWLQDNIYRVRMSILYNKIKKTMNVFDIFNILPQYDSIRNIFDTVVEVDKQSSIKSKIFLKSLNKIKELYKVKPSDQYKNRLLKTISKSLVQNFIINDVSDKIFIPIKKGDTQFDLLGHRIKSPEDGLLKLNNVHNIQTFKYWFENVFIPNLQKGQIYTYKNGKVIETSIKNNDNELIKNLIKIKVNDVPLYKADLNFRAIERSSITQRQFEIFKNAMYQLSNESIQIEDNGESISIPVSDIFILYNLIVNANHYGNDSLTTLFDSAVFMGIYKDYYQYIGKLDFSHDIIFDNEEVSNKESIKLNFKDLLITSARTLSSTYGQTDPFIKIKTDNGIELLENQQKRGSYSTRKYLEKLKDEKDNDFFDRVNDNIQYSVLTETVSDNDIMRLREINNLANRDLALEYINQFIEEGNLIILKNCE